jgi:transposase
MARGEVFLSTKEARRVYVMEQVVAGKITVRQGAKYLGLSERQVKRLKKGMKEKGVAALAHGNRGRTPKHTIPKNIRDVIVSLATGLYRNASAEHMAELSRLHQNISVSAKSITRILRQEGVWDPSVKKHRRRRKSRDRMPKEGMLIQVDASPFDWLEGRGPRLHLHGAIDDATSKVLALYFRPQEDLKGYFQVLRQVVARHGIPRGVYSDGHTIFFSPKTDKLTIEEELAGKQVSLTQLGRALDQLGLNASGRRFKAAWWSN